MTGHPATVERPTAVPRLPGPHGATPSEPLIERAAEAGKVLRLVEAGYTIREVAARLGLSTTTTWRRYRWGEQVRCGRDEDPLPAMRSVRALGLPRRRLLDSGPELYRLRPRPAVRCHARSRSGDQCRAYAIHGGRVCRSHGGAAPQVRRAARARHERAKAGILLADVQARGWDPLAPRKRAEASTERERRRERDNLTPGERP